MSGMCTDPRRGSVWLTDARGQLRKFSARSVITHVRHPVTGNIIQVRHWRQLERLERAAARAGTTIGGELVHTPAGVGTDAARRAAETYFETGDTADGTWVGSSNSEAYRGRRTPRRLALIRSLATLDAAERSEAQISRRVSDATARTVDWVHSELEQRTVSDTDIIDRLGYETRLELLDAAARTVNLRVAVKHSTSASYRERRRTLLEKIDRLGFGADELDDLSYDDMKVAAFVGQRFGRGDGLITHASELLQRAQGLNSSFEQLDKWSIGRFNRPDARVELYAELVAATRDHPVLSEVSAHAAMWLVTSDVTVDDRFDTRTWEEIASDIAKNALVTHGSGPDDRIADTKFVEWADAVGGDPVMYRIVSAAARSGEIIGYRTSDDGSEMVLRGFDTPEDATANTNPNRMVHYRSLSHRTDYGDIAARTLAGMNRRDAVAAHGSLVDAAWAHTLGAGLTLTEADAVALAICENPERVMVRDNPDMLERIRRLPTGAFSAALRVASTDHDLKWAGHDLSIIDGDDRVVVDELGFKHRTRRRSRRARREHHPSAVDSAVRLAYSFGKAWPKYVEAAQRASRSAQNRDATIHELTYWLPTGEHAAEFGQWLTQKRRVQAIFSGRSGEIGLRRIAEEFDKLDDTQKKELSVTEAVAWLRAQGYGGLGWTPLGELAGELDVPPKQLGQVAKRWAATLATPTALPITATWTDERSGLVGRFLPRSDPRGLYLGHLTDCCQYPGSAGESCAWAGCELPLHGFFVVEDREGVVVAQSWVWSDGRGGLCFDNIERKTSTADGWNADWGVDEEPDADAVMSGLDWGSMSPSQRRSWSIRGIYQQAAHGCLDRFDVVTVGTSMTKIPLTGFKRATGNQVLNPHRYNGYRDSQSQAVIATRKRKGAAATVVNVDGADLAWSIGGTAKSAPYRIEVLGTQVTIRVTGDGHFDNSDALARAEQLLEQMGPREWDVTLRDADGAAVGASRELSISGDAEFAVADASVYDVDSDVTVTVDDERYLRTISVANIDDTELARAVYTLASPHRFHNDYAEANKHGVTIEAISALSPAMRETISDSGTPKPYFAAIASGELAELEAAGLSPTACLLSVRFRRQDGSPMDPAIATALTARDDVTLEYVDSGVYNTGSHQQFGAVLTAFAEGDPAVATALLSAVGDNSFIHTLHGLTALPEPDELESLLPLIGAGVRIPEAAGLAALLDERPDWTVDDTNYKFPGGEYDAAVAAAAGMRTHLARNGIRANEWAKLAARVQTSVISTVTRNYNNEPDERLERAVGTARRILDAAETHGIRPKSAGRYPGHFTINDIANAIEAGVGPDDIRPNTPARLSRSDYEWMRERGTEVLDRPWRNIGLHLDGVEEKIAQLDDDTRAALESVGEVDTDLAGLRALEAAGLSDNDVDSLPASWTAIEILEHHASGRSITAAAARELLPHLDLDDVDGLLERGLDTAKLQKLVTSGHNLSQAVALSLTDATKEEMEMIRRLNRFRGYHRAPALSEIDDEYTSAVSRIEAYRKAEHPDAFTKACVALSSNLGYTITDGALDELTKFDDSVTKTLTEAAMTLARHRWTGGVISPRHNPREVTLERKDIRQITAALHTLAPLSYEKLSDVVLAGRRAACINEPEAIILAAAAAKSGVTAAQIASLDRCDVDRHDRALAVELLDGAGWDWVFSTAPKTLRTGTKTAKRVGQRTSVAAHAAKRDLPVELVDTVVSVTGVGAKRAAKQLASMHNDARTALTRWDGDRDAARALLDAGATPDEIASVRSLRCDGRTAADAVRWYRGGLPVADWVDAGATIDDVAVLADGGWADIAGLEPEAAVALSRNGTSRDAISRCARAAADAGIDTASFDANDWELMAAGGDALAAGVDPRAAAFTSAGIDAELAAKLVENSGAAILADPAERDTLIRVAGGIGDSSDILAAVAAHTVIDSADAVAELCESAAADDIVEVTAETGRIPASVVRAALERPDGVDWLREWRDTAPDVAPTDWVVATDLGLTPADAQPWASTSLDMTDAATLHSLGVAADSVADIDADGATLIAAARHGLLNPGLPTPDGDDLAAVIESKLPGDTARELLEGGATWSHLAGGEAAVLWRRGVDPGDIVEAVAHLDDFPVRNAASFTGRVRSFTAAGLAADDAAWFTDCSAAQAKAFTEAGCDGRTYGEFVRRYRDLGLDANDTSPAARRRQIQRWVSSGVSETTAGQVNARAQHHAASLR